MRTLSVTLVNPPHQAALQGEANAIAPPLGLLRLASAAARLGHTPRVLDLNLEWHRDACLRSDFYWRALELILKERPDIVGFTSMAVDTHVAIEFCRLLKKHDPEIVTVVGGPHAGSIASDIYSRWPWIDLVIAGDGCAAFCSAIQSVARRRSRSLHDAAVQSLRADPASTPDSSTWDYVTGYSLVDWNAYFSVSKRRQANVEAGRGCRYRC